MYNQYKKASNGQPYCEFCGKTKNKVKVLVAGPGVFICDECVAICHKIVSSELQKIKQQEVNSL